MGHSGPYHRSSDSSDSFPAVDELDMLFIVSDVNLVEKPDFEPPSGETWSFQKIVPMQGTLIDPLYATLTIRQAI